MATDKPLILFFRVSGFCCKDEDQDEDEDIKCGIYRVSSYPPL